MNKYDVYWNTWFLSFILSLILMAIGATTKNHIIICISFIGYFYGFTAYFIGTPHKHLKCYKCAHPFLNESGETKPKCPKCNTTLDARLDLCLPWGKPKRRIE